MLNFYSLDRSMTVDSFKCYWQIDNMIQHRKFEEFKIELAHVDVDAKAEDEELPPDGKLDLK